MPTVPGLTVLLDDGSGSFPLNITSKVLAVGYEISRGRDDWQGAVTAGELTLTLNNSDGRFTPGSTILGSPSPIKVDQRIRLKETVNGVTYTRCTVYVKSWPVAWPEVVTTFSTVQLTATDAQARAERRPLRSMLEEEILLDSPVAYYTLGEAEGSTSAGDTSGNGLAALSIAGSGSHLVVGGEDGPISGLAAVDFTGGQYLTGPTLSPAIPGVFSVVCWVKIPTPNAVSFLQIADGWTLAMTAGGVIQGFGNGTALMTGFANIADGTWHQVGITSDGSNARLFFDGQVDSGGSASAPFSTPPAPMTVGAVGSTHLTGAIAHVVAVDGVLSSAQVLDLFNAVAGIPETADARLARLASYAGIPVGTLDASATVVPAQQTSGVSAQDAFQEVADAEMGLVFIDGSGNLTFHNRGRVTSKTTPDLTLDSQYVTPDVQPVTDDQQIVNYVEATAAGTGGMSVILDAASDTAHGRYPDPQTYLVQTDAEALDRANWIVVKQAEPTVRYGTLTINLYKMTPALAGVVVNALDLDCWLRVTSLASQNPGGSVADVVVQGWRAQVSAEGWAITCNVVSHSLYTAFILDSSLLDGPDLLAV